MLCLQRKIETQYVIFDVSYDVCIIFKYLYNYQQINQCLTIICTHRIFNSIQLNILNIIIQQQPSEPLYLQIEYKHMSKPSRSKLKTMPNELSTVHQHFAFQSQDIDNHHDSDHMKKINISSPTFATNQLPNLSNNNHSNNNNNEGQREREDGKQSKENRISLCLREMKVKDNASTNVGSTGKYVTGKDNQNYIESTKKNDLIFMRAQNQKLVQKCHTLDQNNKNLQEENKILDEKLKILKKCVKDKFEQVVQFMQAPNSSPNDTNLDIYLNFRLVKDQYKIALEAAQKLSKQNQLKDFKIKELETIITNYTEKSEKKKMEKMQNNQRVRQIERQFNDKIEQIKRKSQIRQKQLQNQIKQRQRQIKKCKDEYEKLKFLKQEIEKKRIEDIKVRQQLQIQKKQLQTMCLNLQQQAQKSQQEHQNVIRKLQLNTKQYSTIQQQLQSQKQQLSTLKLTMASTSSQNTHLKQTLDSHKQINEKYQQQLTQLRKQNQLYYDNCENAKIQKDKLQAIIAKCQSNQQRSQRKIVQLQSKLQQSEKQLQQIKFQYEQLAAKSSNRNYPDISKFKQQQEISQRETHSRLETSSLEQRIKILQDKHNKIVEELNKEIQQLRKSKESLELDLDSEREKNDKINLQLQNTYRRMQQFGNTYNEDRDQARGQFRDTKDRHYRRQLYNSNPIIFPQQLTRTTKATPQLKMIRQILLTILNSAAQPDKMSSNNNKLLFRCDKQTNTNPQRLIQQIKKLAQQTADLFDTNSKDIINLQTRVQNKQEVISKLLRFTPEQKKSVILQYLKVMENIDDYQVDHMYKVTKNLQDQANQWKRYVFTLNQNLSACQDQIVQLRKQLNRLKTTNSNNNYDGARTSDIGAGMRKYDNYTLGNRQRQRDRIGAQKVDKYDRERIQDRFPDKYEYRKY